METIVKTKTENKQTITICLNGGAKQKDEFVKLCREAYQLDSLSTIGIDFICIPVNDTVIIQLFDLAGMERSRTAPLSTINKSDAIIILEDSNLAHMGTEKQACFDYKSFNKPPKEFLESIIDTILKHQETMALLNSDVKKTLFFTACCNENAVPIEVTNIVKQHLVNDYSFFSNQGRLVYTKLPTQVSQAEPQKESVIDSVLKLFGLK